jgi:hypothetical protein
VPRFIEVVDPHAVSVSDAARTARAVGATHVLVTFEDDSPGLLSTAGLSDDDTAPIADRVESRLPPIQLKADPGATPRRAFQRAGMAVVYSGDEPLMVELDEPFGDLQIADLIEANLFAADTRLPGPPGELDDPIVVYTCPNGDEVRQRQSDPNRECRCGGRLSR